MNKLLQRVWWVLVIVNGFGYGFGPKTLVVLRSQGFNNPRWATGWQRAIHRPHQDNNYYSVSITPEYSHSFHERELTNLLFGCHEQIVSGSRVAHRAASDIMADYFGLPSDFKSVVQFDPEIINFVFDLHGYIGLDGLIPGLYIKAHLPIIHTKWDVQLDECVADAGTTFTSYPAGYLASTPIELSSLVQGEKAPTNMKKVLEGNAAFGDMLEPLKFGKVFGRQRESRVGEFRVEAGYYTQSDRYHGGVGLCVAVPSGTARKSEFLFEPIAGNDHHWELGGTVSGCLDVWNQDEKDRCFSVKLDATITHLFGSKQKRSFDLINNGNGSRYMLLQRISSPVINLHVGLAPDDVLAPNQYQGFLVPAINRTTLDVTIAIDVQADVVVSMNYRRHGWEFEGGYNLWVRSNEKLKDRDCFAQNYAIKGDAQIYGFSSPGDAAIALNATQSNATIHRGQTITSPVFASLDPGNFNEGFEYANINADNIEFASDLLGVALNQLAAADAARLGVSVLPVRTSNPAILLTDTDINESSGLLSRAFSHKLFAYIGYQPDPEARIVPYCGGGAFVEFGHASSDVAGFHAQWGLWLRLGVSR